MMLVEIREGGFDHLGFLPSFLVEEDRRAVVSSSTNATPMAAAGGRSPVSSCWRTARCSIPATRR
jgi:hypothetical protein